MMISKYIHFPPRKLRLASYSFGIGLLAGALYFAGTHLISAHRHQPTSASKPKAAIEEPAANSSSQLGDWVDKYGDLFSVIREDFSQIGSSWDNRDAMKAACGNLAQDTSKFMTYPPIPLASAESDWRSALTLYKTGADDCTQGINSHNNALLDQASQQWDQGSEKLRQVTAEIKNAVK